MTKLRVAFHLIAGVVILIYAITITLGIIRKIPDYIIVIALLNAVLSCVEWALESAKKHLEQKGKQSRE